MFEHFLEAALHQFTIIIIIVYSLQMSGQVLFKHFLLSNIFLVFLSSSASVSNSLSFSCKFLFSAFTCKANKNQNSYYHLHVSKIVNVL